MDNKEFQDQVLDKLDKLGASIFGNGMPGIKTKLAKVEQIVGLQSKASWIIFAAVVGIIAKMIIC